MKTIVAFAALTAFTIPSAASAGLQDDRAKRLVSAVQGKSEYVDADFVEPLTDASKEALSQFSDCELRFIGEETSGGVIVQPTLGRRRTDSLVVGLICEGHSKSAGAGFTVHFVDTKIASIETHAPKVRRESHG